MKQGERFRVTLKQLVNIKNKLFKAAREIADNYIESQKQIINSLQSAWVPQIEAANRVFNANWVSPRHLADNYARVVSTLADNTIAANTMLNNAIFANLEHSKHLFRMQEIM